eukprot:TRINITY_DN14961_c0_g1_i1.p1 TRINITY_DN14961_c0_g1~~TRINITY_DN14961_c0_g1_i1.p1  ORF type:complete len:380 (+),score=101.35 TRINITY_DN14961_c0_g1_i1:152-1291(+)
MSAISRRLTTRLRKQTFARLARSPYVHHEQPWQHQKQIYPSVSTNNNTTTITSIRTTTSNNNNKMPMLFVLSPAKTLDFECKDLPTPVTSPAFPTQTTTIVKKVALLPKAKLKSLLGVSDNLATLNHNRFKTFDKQKEKACIIAYKGPAYVGVDAASLSETQLQRLQEQTYVISGLYGLLRPLDVIRPYRLCFGTKFAVDDKHNTLYEYWGDALSEKVNAQLAARVKGKGGDGAKKFLINCASQEYSKALPREALDEDITVINCVFKDKGRIIATFAKKARGLMIRYAAAVSTCNTPEDLKKFDSEGYKYVAAQSDQSNYVFARASPPTKATTTAKKGTRGSTSKTAAATKRSSSSSPRGKKGGDVDGGGEERKRSRKG